MELVRISSKNEAWLDSLCSSSYDSTRVDSVLGRLPRGTLLVPSRCRNIVNIDGVHLRLNSVSILKSSRHNRTYKSSIITARQPNQETLVAKTRNVDKRTIRAFRERGRVLQSAVGNIAPCAIGSSRLSIAQRLNSIVSLSWESKFQQALQVHSRGLNAPALGREKVEMTSKVEAPAQRRNSETSAFGNALYRLTSVLRLLSS